MTTMTKPADDTAVRLLSFVEPLPGFPDEDAYNLSAIDPRGMLYSLRSVTAPELRFVLTPTAVFFADYRPDIPAAVAHALGADDLELMLILSIGAGLADATANMRAPLAISPTTARAMQVILDDERLPMHRRLIPTH